MKWGGGRCGRGALAWRLGGPRFESHTQHSFFKLQEEEFNSRNTLRPRTESTAHSQKGSDEWAHTGVAKQPNQLCGRDLSKDRASPYHVECTSSRPITEVKDGASTRGTKNTGGVIVLH